MTSDEYNGILRALGLQLQPGAFSSEADMYRDRSGELHRIPKPSELTEEQRIEFVEILKLRLGISNH